MATGRPPPIPGKLVVRGYPLGTKDEEIRSWFEPFGELEEGDRSARIKVSMKMFISSVFL